MHVLFHFCLSFLSSFLRFHLLSFRSFVDFFFFFLAALGFEHTASCSLGRYSTTPVTPPALFALVIFERRS
jgi:hypothetical protein